jgi:hypothetical protein
LRRQPLREKSVYEQQLYENIVTGSASSVVVSREVLNDVGLFDEDMVLSDWDLWLRISRRHSFHYVDTPLTCLRRHGTNQSVNLDLMADGVQRMWRKLDRDVPDEVRFTCPARECACRCGSPGSLRDDGDGRPPGRTRDEHSERRSTAPSSRPGSWGQHRFAGL